MIKEKKEYDPEIMNKCNEKWKANKIKYLEKQLSQLKSAV